MATAEFYPNLKEIRCFRTDTRLEYEPPVDKIEKCFLEENEGKMVSVAICCTKCGCLLANERKRRILSLPTSDWESLHFGCSETKKMSDAHIKRARKARYDMILFCALWIEIKVWFSMIVYIFCKDKSKIIFLKVIYF